MTAALVRCGLVDMTGRLLPRDEFAAEHPDSPLLDRLEPVGEYNNAFFLTRGEHPVYLSQEDIRQIQLAKSSICAGCLTLCHEHGIEPEELDSLILAGAFGNYIDVDNALYIGLLPAAPRDRVVAVGNGAGQRRVPLSPRPRGERPLRAHPCRHASCGAQRQRRIHGAVHHEHEF